MKVDFLRVQTGAGLRVIFAFAFLAGSPAVGQKPVAQPAAPPKFEVVTIKPSVPGKGITGVYVYPGGKVVIGAEPLQQLIAYAYDLQLSQVKTTQKWMTTKDFDVTALSLDPSSAAADPRHSLGYRLNSTQRLMLQQLLKEDFSLVAHASQKIGPVYILERGSGKLELVEPKDATREPTAAVFMKGGGIVDGEASGRNVTMEYLAQRFGAELDRPLLNRTGIEGAYDFHTAPADPKNEDMATAVFEVARRLGLKITSSKGSITQLVVETAREPQQ